MTMIYRQVRVKKIVPNKKGDIGMEVYYLCQPNTYVIACEFGNSYSYSNIVVHNVNSFLQVQWQILIFVSGKTYKFRLIVDS